MLRSGFFFPFFATSECVVYCTTKVSCTCAIFCTCALKYTRTRYCTVEVAMAYLYGFFKKNSRNQPNSPASKRKSTHTYR